MFGDLLMLRLKLTIPFSKAYSIQLILLFTSQTMFDKAKRLIVSQRLELNSLLRPPNHTTDPISK